MRNILYTTIRGLVVGVADILEVGIVGVSRVECDHALEPARVFIVIVLGAPTIAIVDPGLLADLIETAGRIEDNIAAVPQRLSTLTR